MESEVSRNPWRVLEFYSGIGGLRYSLLKAAVNATVVEAFDINDVANDVYQHNFGHRPFQGNIQTLNAADLDSYNADAWLLSPPCQPYTRQGLQKGSSDARASSFLKILELVPQLLQPPSYLFVENVVGFETSDTHAILVDILEKNNFVTQEFILSPLQFGLPYSRPRYYCLDLNGATEAGSSMGWERQKCKPGTQSLPLFCGPFGKKGMQEFLKAKLNLRDELLSLYVSLKHFLVAVFAMQ
ncbi:hypothetical protein MTR67_036025 [Solanum verrucosum]|uniref:Uncharacterized protein n=1 Tax=Solanum verrucosum TaxID=315347 RepID=A0AAF0UAT3_SOLVR|nr:hypothetical protein MTR67_036025 [Solanum verrucosum]